MIVLRADEAHEAFKGRLPQNADVAQYRFGRGQHLVEVIVARPVGVQRVEVDVQRQIVPQHIRIVFFALLRVESPDDPIVDARSIRLAHGPDAIACDADELAGFVDGRPSEPIMLVGHAKIHRNDCPLRNTTAKLIVWPGVQSIVRQRARFILA